MIVDVNPAAVPEERFRANRFDLVSSLADDLAHEIKNPLNSIIVNLEVLKVRLARADAAGAADRALVIEGEVRRLHQLVDRMLMLLRPERDEATHVPLDAVLDEIMPLIEAQVRLARNQLRCDGPTSVLVLLRRDDLKFAVLNLVLAVHARLGEDGGALAIRCSHDERHVHLVIDAEAVAGGPAPQQEAALERAVAMAAALLSGTASRIETRPGGVSLSLPRSVAT